MDELTLISQLRADPPPPRPSAVARARNRLAAEATEPERASRQSTRGRPWSSWGSRLPAWALPRWRIAGAAALSLALTTGWLLTEAVRGGPDRHGPLTASPASAAQLLDQAAQAASRAPYRLPTAKQFVFQDQVFDDAALTDGGQVSRHREQSRVWWRVDDPDARVTCSRRVTEPPAAFDCDQPPSAPMPRTGRWRLDSRSPQYLSQLPTEPRRLLDQLRADTSVAHATAEPASLAEVITDLVASPLTTPELRAALLRAVALLPGVIRLDEAADAAGRTGVAVAWTADGLRHELVLDPADHRYLGYRTVLVEHHLTDLAGMPVGTVVHSTALLDGAIVDRARQVP